MIKNNSKVSSKWIILSNWGGPFKAIKSKIGEIGTYNFEWVHESQYQF